MNGGCAIDRWMRRALLAAALVCGAGAAGANPLADALTGAEPCAGLRLDLGFMTVAVDRTELVAVDRASLELAGDAVTARIDGRIACAAGPDAAVAGDVGARVEATLAGDLETCAFDPPEVRLSDFTGSLADALSALAGPAEGALADRLRQEAERACRGER